MNRTLPNIRKNHLRQLFIFAAAALVILTSCSVRSSIKGLAGVPVNTEKGIAKSNHNFLGNASETCVIGETTDIQISQTASFTSDDLLPAFFLTVTFLFLFGFRPCKKQTNHPLYGNLKIPGTLPLFLLYRKLIVYHSS